MLRYAGPLQKYNVIRVDTVGERLEFKYFTPTYRLCFNLSSEIFEPHFNIITHCSLYSVGKVAKLTPP